MMRIATTILRLGSAPVGIGIGVWTAVLLSLPGSGCPDGASMCNSGIAPEPTFATWQCALFGAGAAAVVLLMSFGIARLPSTRTHSVG